MKILKLYGVPGSGKTFRLLQLMEQELKTLDSSQLAFLTFTRSARLEALARVGGREEDHPFLRTIHAVCYRALNLTRGRIASHTQIRAFGVSIGVELSGNPPSPWYEEVYGRQWQSPTEGDQMIAQNHLCRHRLMDLEEGMGYDLNVNLRYFRWFGQEYRAWKAREGVLDYTDILEEYLKFGNPLPVKAGIVDEAQDLSRLQWKVVHRLLSKAERAYYAGDDDQAIFSFAGAEPAAFLNAYADQEEVLTKSYRLPAAVKAFAEQVSARISIRKEKTFAPRDVEGEVGINAGLYPEDLSTGKRAFVLYRNGYHAGRLEDRLREVGVPYLGGSSPCQAAHVALTTWQKLVKGQMVTKVEAKAFLAAAHPHVVHPQAEGQLRELNGFKAEQLLTTDGCRDLASRLVVLGNLPHLLYLRAAERDHGLAAVLDPNLHLMSIHQSKGREADLVVLDPSMTRRTFEGYQTQPDDEHRVFYVGCTRTREKLLVLWPEGTMGYRF